MKNILKIFTIGVAVAAVASGCTKNFPEYNPDKYAIHEANPSMLLPTMVEAMMYIQQNDSQMIDQMVGTLGGYYTLSNRWGGQNFDTFNPSDGWNAIPYDTPFVDIYGNFFEVEKQTNGSGHFYALAKLIRAAAMMRISDCYGPIPYSKVMDGKMYVEYDTNEQVYENIIADLKDAAEALVTYTQNNPGSKPFALQDAVYEGDYAKWAKLANSYIMRAAMRSGNQQAFVDAVNSKAGYIESNSDNAMMNPKGQPNPLQLASASWGDIRANASIVDYMNGYADPRRAEYFTETKFEGMPSPYVGMRAGKGEFDKGKMTNYSMPNLEGGDALPVFVAAESNFLLAEAVLKGWIDGDAEKYYKEGIMRSMEQWGVMSGVTEYIADDKRVPASFNDPTSNGFGNYTRKTDVKVAWSAATTDEEHLEQIITQKWIANYPMGLEAWSEFRRTGYPELTPAMDNLSGGAITDVGRGMRRLRYPLSEKDYNTTNYQKAVEMLGGVDNEGVDLFWAKKK